MQTRDCLVKKHGRAKFADLMNAVDVLNRRYVPLLRAMANVMRQRHPAFVFNVGSNPIGSNTAYQGHDVYLECLRPESRSPEPNCLALEIGVRDLPHVPMLCTLDVTWGGDGVPPSAGLYLLESEIVFGTNAVRLIDAALPRLQDHFEQCLQDWERAHPI